MNLPFSPARFKKAALTTFETLEFNQVRQQVLALSKALMQIDSISPEDKGCQSIIRDRLSAMGFDIEDMSRNGVTNTWACRGSNGPMLVLAGHTDVVPPGPLSFWHTPPFSPTISGDQLLGRGAADMKTGLAALLIAAERFVAKYPNHRGKLAFAITSDEEGIAADGTQAIIDQLQQRNVIPQWCLVGEPSSKQQVGDAIRIGRRGSLIGKLKVTGVQGHVAYAHTVVNPIHKVQKLMHKMANKQWDFPSRYFPATSFQITRFNSDSGAMNLTPTTAEVQFNFRYSPKQNKEKLKKYVHAKLAKLQVNFDIDWFDEAEPYFCRRSALLNAVKQSLVTINGHEPELSTAGGTSDGRFFAAIGSHVVELGVSNQTIHQCNEAVDIDALTKLVFIYQSIIEKLVK